MQFARCICVHAHFYQPPREDPWTEWVMKDITALPYHDWNERISKECYEPNAAARMLNDRGEIIYITNNYRHISFNVGPTLHNWLAKTNTRLSHSIVMADKRAAKAIGEGGAIAQGYNHMILPLACARDIRTQVIWGAKDFEHRFGRKPKGMWLPETAVNTAVLEVLASEGIEFTILAPSQCARVRQPDGEWTDTPGGNGLDVTRPYFMRLPSGRKISIVFYYGGVAQDIAFGGLLNNGDAFAHSLMSKVPFDDEPRLLSVATDGESYGHHHRYGEMALARAIETISSSYDFSLTNIAAFLSRYPAKWECRIAEDTSWSCAHGIERWRSDCGCHTGGGYDWNQKWRAPLRDAFDDLRDKIDEIYEREMVKYCDSPWRLRDEAIMLYMMNFSEKATSEDVKIRKDAFLKARCGNLSFSDTNRVLTLLEAQRMRMFMYTSCGWFFNDISGIETRQIIAYAVRAAEHIKAVTGMSLEGGFTEALRKAHGNTEEFPTGYDVFAKCVAPMKRTIKDIAASAALMSSSDSYYSYCVKSVGKVYPSGDIDLAVKKIAVTNTLTLENWSGTAAVISTSGLDDVCRMTEQGIPPQKEIWNNFYVGDILSISRYLERVFELGSWHLKDLAIDDREVVGAERTKAALRENVEYAERLLQDHQRLLVQLNIIGAECPKFLEAVTVFVYGEKINDIVTDTVNILDLLKPDSRLEALIDEARNIGIEPGLSSLVPRVEKAFCDAVKKIGEKDEALQCENLIFMWKRAKNLGINIEKSETQNRLWDILMDRSDSLPPALVELTKVVGFATQATNKKL
ncbi:glycoside hydrolase [Synergistales bacterium]|nr:glycoside hydrolase [Synergistales bacterium]